MREFSKNPGHAASAAGVIGTTLAGVVIPSPQHKKDRSQHPEAERRDEVGLGAHLPQKCAAEGGHRNHNIPQKVVQAEHAGLARFRRQVHDQGFAGRLPELLEPAHDKRQHEPFERLG